MERETLINRGSGRCQGRSIRAASLFPNRGGSREGSHQAHPRGPLTITPNWPPVRCSEDRAGDPPPGRRSPALAGETSARAARIRRR
jgi:hypothetical protein